MPRAQKTIQEKVQAEFPEFAETVVRLSVEELNKRLSDYAKHRHEVQESRANDSDLEQIKATVSEMNAPYNDALKAIEMKSKYIICLIAEKGGTV